MKIDSWLIDSVFQPFSHWFQRLTGKDNFYLARMVLYTQLFCVGIMTTWFPLVLIFLLLLCPFVTIALIKIISITENVCHEDLVSGCRNRYYNAPMVVLTRMFAVFSFFLLQMQMVRMEIDIGFVTGMSAAHFTVCISVIIVLYLCACTPLPPGESKIRKWLNSLKGSFSSSSVPDPTPA